MAGLIAWMRCLLARLRERESRSRQTPDKPAIEVTQLREPYILVFCGHPCGGKSYLHEAFKKAHPEVSSDENEEDEMDQIRSVKLTGPINDESARGAAYRLLHFYASRKLSKRQPVTLNATYMPQRHRAELAALAVRSEVPIYIVQCVCSPEIAVKRFQERRPGEHAGSDLTALRVRQLAERYERFDGALLLNTDATQGAEPYLSYINDYLNGDTPADPIRWAQHDYSGPHTKPAPPSESRSAPSKKLSEASVRAAKRLRWLYRLGVCSLLLGAIFGVSSVLLKLGWILHSTMWPWYSSLRGNQGWIHAFLQSFSGAAITLFRRSLEEDALVEWVHFSVLCLTVAGLASIVIAFYHDSRAQREEAETWAAAGMNPRYFLNPGDTRPPDREIFHAYQSRLKPSGTSRLPIMNVPVFFQTLPSHRNSFSAQATKGIQIASELPQEAARFSLDWEGFQLWRKEERQKEYPFAYSHEYGLRCVSMKSPSADVPVCEMEVVRSEYGDYVCAEHSVNLVSPGALPDMRRLMEGRSWDSGELDLGNIEESAKRYSMRMSTTALILTQDNYFVLQRRSQRVATGMGNLGSAASGAADYFADSANTLRGFFVGLGWIFAHVPWPGSSHWLLWKILKVLRLQPTKWDLRSTALRETREEIGLAHRDFLKGRDWSDTLVPPFECPFLGAAFNLLYGRDLNFYCCFRTTLRSDQISACRKKRQTRDRWEVDNLVLLDHKKVTMGAIQRGELDRLLPNRSRHLLGALYAWAVYVGQVG